MRTRRISLAFLAAALLAAVACGGGGSHDSAQKSAGTTGTTGMTSTTGMAGGGDMGSTTTAAATRTVDIEMRDIAYSPNAVTVQAGETVRFVFHNAGQIRHDAFLGDAMAQDEHEHEMRSETSASMSGSKDMKSDHGVGILVDPGATGEITHTFQKGDQLLIGCHEAGHYAAGMRITITVS
ncbi:MAG TPA: cupredoxin domain-containing protein, partial [Acidimicrobiia bacterium]|nr:cupredoxin domain-containing protein [Acidimicrobiia bacterium]